MQVFQKKLPILPLLFLLAMPPMTFNKNEPSRSIASNNDRYNQLINSDQDTLSLANRTKNVDELCSKLESLNKELDNSISLFKHEVLTSTIIEKQRQKVQTFSREIYFSELDLKNHLTEEASVTFVDDKAPTPFMTEEIHLDQKISDAKDKVEQLLISLEENENHVPIQTVSETVKEEVAIKEEKCEGANNIQTSEVSTLIQEQNKILTSLMEMNQNMMNFIKNQTFENPYYSNSIYDRGLAYSRSPYIYHISPQNLNYVKPTQIPSLSFYLPYPNQPQVPTLDENSLNFFNMGPFLPGQEIQIGTFQM
jgi:hypothetical protein